MAWSIWTPPSLPRRLSKRRWSSGQMPASVHSVKRRQQEDPLTWNASVGNLCQGTPQRSTKMMPLSAALLSTGGRPPLLDGGGGSGNNGLISIHSSSGSSSAAIFATPCAGVVRGDHRPEIGRAHV